VGKRHRQIRVVELLDGPRSIQRVIRTAIESSRDRDVSRTDRISTAVSVQNGCRRRRSGKREKVDYVPAVERQVENTSVLHTLADADLPRFHQRRIGLHFDLLGNLTDFHNDIESRAAVHLENESALNEFTKTRQ